jgi:hypothetical protein
MLARALNSEIARAFDENDIYRIDHFLGKEIVQNLFVLRFASGTCEPVWNRNYAVGHENTNACEPPHPFQPRIGLGPGYLISSPIAVYRACGGENGDEG